MEVGKSGNRGGLQGRVRGSGRGRAHGRQRWRRGRRGVPHITLDRGGRPGPTFTPAENSFVTSLSDAGGEGEEETAKGLNGKLEEMKEEKNELKTKISKLECDLMYKSMQMKAMNIHVERLEKQIGKLSASLKRVWTQVSTVW